MRIITHKRKKRYLVITSPTSFHASTYDTFDEAVSQATTAYEQGNGILIVEITPHAQYFCDPNQVVK